jgi:hypothetical protein
LFWSGTLMRLAIGLASCLARSPESSAGFIAVAPDLFWRQEPSVDLSVTSEPDWRHGLRLNQAYDREAGAGDVKDTADDVAKLTECRRTRQAAVVIDECAAMGEALRPGSVRSLSVGRA